MDPSDKQAAKYKSKNLMGYIQDRVDVGMTKLRSDEGVLLDVAILKSTIQDPVIPKEKHVVTLKVGCSASAPRQQVNYVIHGLSKRLEEKSGWLVTLKTLIVFHRLLREVDPSFQEEIIKYQERTGAHRMLRLDGFADHTTKDTWDFSAWIRVYSVYLDERLGVFKSMRFDPELESGDQAPTDHAKESKLKSCAAPELLERLPPVQKLLARLIACVPEGSAQHNEIVLQSCVMVMRELRSTYRAVCEGIINLADKFFEMERSDALRALDAYKDNMALNERLNTFLSAINNVPALKGAVQMPALQSLPPDFLATMEEYVRDAPKVLDASNPSRASAGPTGGLRTSTMLRQQGATSSAIAGTTAAGSGGPGPVLKIGQPTDSAAPATSPTPATAPATAPSIDLLGDDFSAPAPTQPAQQQQGFGDDAFGTPPAFGVPSPRPAGQEQGFPPHAPPGGFAPFPAQPQPQGHMPGAANPFVQAPPNAFHAPPGVAHNPFVLPGGPAPNAFNPAMGGYTGAGSAPGYPQPPSSNPFGGAGPAWGAGPPQGTAAWGTNVVPGSTTMKRTPDPLSAIGADLFGGKNVQPVQQSLRDMKQMHL